MSTTVVSRLPRLFGPRRLAIYVLASFVLHAWLLGIFDRGLRVGKAGWSAPAAPIEATWVETPAAATSARSMSAAAPAVKAAPGARRAQPKVAAPAPEPTSAPLESTAPTAETSNADGGTTTTAAPADAMASASEPAAEPVPVSPASDATPTPAPAEPLGDNAAPPPLHIDRWPPNGMLKFKAQAVQGKTPYYGTGELRWRMADGRYRIEQTMGLDLLITTLRLQSSTSEGSVGDDGLSPDRYTEQRRSRATVATNFNREPEKRSITFSATSKSFALEDGAQDRASVLFQLAGVVLSAADPAHIGTYELQLAGVRGVETWSFALVGEEHIETGAGEIAALHFERLPRPESYESKVEIWYSAACQGYPVRIRYTERNGDVIDLVLDAYQVGDGA